MHQNLPDCVVNSQRKGFPVLRALEQAQSAQTDVKNDWILNQQICFRDHNIQVISS